MTEGIHANAYCAGIQTKTNMYRQTNNIHINKQTCTNTNMHTFKINRQKCVYTNIHAFIHPYIHT